MSRDTGCAGWEGGVDVVAGDDVSEGMSPVGNSTYAGFNLSMETELVKSLRSNV